MSVDVLQEPVAKFIEELVPVLDHIAKDVPGIDRAKLPQDVAQEAYNLCAAFVAADGRFTDEELWAFLGAFANRFEHLLLRYATPAQLRDSRLLHGKETWIGTPSVLFDILLRSDTARHTTYSWRYYERAMALAHAVCATDALPSRDELAALDRYRSMLLRAMEASGVGRPGATRTGGPVVSGPDGTGPRTEPPLPPPRPLEELLDELDDLVGLDAVKREVKLVTNLLQVQKLRKERGLPVPEASRHLVFTGNPGTGKTTVARLLAQIYRTLGVVEKGQLVETDRSGLVAGYVGQTALKVRQVFESALGGVLLIDEAYALARGSERADFGMEAIDTLVKLVEDHRDEIVVIVAGYPEEMRVFVESNPGLRSRFPKTIHFPDYATDELVAIFRSLCERNGYTCPPETEAVVRSWFDAQPRDKGFGNARLSRNLFEAALGHHAMRVVTITEPTDEQLSALLPEDIVG